LALSKQLNISREDIILGLKHCENITLRQKLINLKRFYIYDDTYSSSPEAIRADIEYLKFEYPQRTLSFALGDMLELGKETIRLHKQIGSEIYFQGARKLYAFGAYAFVIRDGAKNAGMNEEDIFVFTESEAQKTISHAIYENSVDGEIVLIKASHALRAEKIIQEIERLDEKC
jgi:UDP-N-acetylmuramoyl-tripeptide--D-alanyl-D-alanine ligase